MFLTLSILKQTKISRSFNAKYAVFTEFITILFCIQRLSRAYKFVYMYRNIKVYRKRQSVFLLLDI